MDGRIRFELPKDVHSGQAIELKDAATALGATLKNKEFWFLFQNRVNFILEEPRLRTKELADGTEINIEGEERLQFQPITNTNGNSQLQTICEIGNFHIDDHGEIYWVTAGLGAACLPSLLAANQLLSELPRVERIIDVPIPVVSGGKLILPAVGYDERLETYLKRGSPEINYDMPLEEARGWIDELLGSFCYADAQSKTHSLARLFSPYMRGIIGFGHKHPLWFFLANRPRAGKDYLNGCTQIIYLGHAFEGAPLALDPGENRKYITAALCSGRRMINFANCQGPINCPNFMSLITNNRMGGLRMLGSSDAAADLELRNEADISISANEGRAQWQEDVAMRARFIRLAFFEEDANSRLFPIPHLHDWVLKHRAEILSAIHAHVREWWVAGAPLGTTPFNSFPHWAEKVGWISFLS